MELRELEETLRAEAGEISAKGADWPAAEVSRRLLKIADQIAAIRQEGTGGINASMGKRSGWKLEI